MKLHSVGRRLYVYLYVHKIPACRCLQCVPEVSVNQKWQLLHSARPAPELPSSLPLHWTARACPLRPDPERKWAWQAGTPPRARLHSLVLPAATWEWVCRVHSWTNSCFSLSLHQQHQHQHQHQAAPDLKMEHAVIKNMYMYIQYTVSDSFTHEPVK